MRERTAGTSCRVDGVPAQCVPLRRLGRRVTATCATDVPACRCCFSIRVPLGLVVDTGLHKCFACWMLFRL